MHAIARIVYHGSIPNIQVSWVKIGVNGAIQLLQSGCNDLGGTLMNENISRAAGAAHGQEMTPQRFAQLSERLGRHAEQRTTGYGRVATGAAAS
jgi:FO synthase